MQETNTSDGILYLVATPIGNLKDITVRALDVLRSVDLVLAEDTRRTRRLLTHHQIRARLRAHHQHNERDTVARLIEKLREGRRIALVSDAGTPSISDPGFLLARAAMAAAIRVVPIPGASAVLTALVASGLPCDRFTFLGYPPRKQLERRRLFDALSPVQGTLILLESPRRLAACLEDAAELFGTNRPAVMAREMTKVHEEFVRGTLGGLLRQIEDLSPRGEITLCIGAAEGIDKDDSAARARRTLDVTAHYKALCSAGVDRHEALRQVACERGMRRKDVYEAMVPDRKSRERDERKEF